MDPLFQAVLITLLILLGFGLEHMRIRWVLWKKRKARRFMSYRKDPEPQMGRWTPEHGRSAWR